MSVVLLNGCPILEAPGEDACFACKVSSYESRSALGSSDDNTPVNHDNQNSPEKPEWNIDEYSTFKSHQLVEPKISSEGSQSVCGKARSEGYEHEINLHATFGTALLMYTNWSCIWDFKRLQATSTRCCISQACYGIHPLNICKEPSQTTRDY